MTNWLPNISNSNGPKYLAIADAIGHSVSSGQLPIGTKLPPHRNLSYDLGITVGTVTRGYREAERRGLIGGEIGRGTYVLDQGQTKATGFSMLTPTPPGVIDLGRASPVVGDSGVELSKTLQQIALDPNIDVLTTYQTETGLQQHLDAGAVWLEHLGHKDVSADRISLTNGNHHGILVSIMTLVAPGETILVEPLTYPGIIHIARTFGYRLEVVATDDQGIIPEALEEACRRFAPKVLYCMPKAHNPTAVVTPLHRRKAIANAAEQHGFFIIEDNIMTTVLEDGAQSFADLIPDRTIHLVSLSKCMAGGLRIGYALSPERLTQRVRISVRATCWMPAPLMAEIARRWITDGTGEKLRDKQQAALSERLAISLKYLAPYNPRYKDGFHHIWLELPEPWQVNDFKTRAENRNVRIVSADSFAVDKRNAPQAVRLSIGQAESLEILATGMSHIADILNEDPYGDTSIAMM